MATPEIAERADLLPEALAREAARGGWDAEGRIAAAAAFSGMTMPNWRRGRGWTLEPPPLDLGAYAPAPPPAEVATAGRAVAFADGRLETLPADLPEGVAVYDLRSPDLPAALGARLGEASPARLGKLEALSRAAYTGGAAVEIAADTRMERPLEIRQVLRTAGCAAMPRLLIVVRAGAAARLLLSVRGEDDGATLNVGVTELILDEGASLDVVDLTGLGSGTYGVIRRHAAVGRGAKVVWTSGAFGGGFLSLLWKADLLGADASLAATGIYVTTGKEQHSLESNTEHLAPHTRANVVFRGAVGGRGRSVFDGILSSVKTAMDTQSYLGDHILFLSPDARADAIPRLDIEGSDVNIQHGASVGRVDPEQVYYLTTRGIGPELAREMLVMGYFDPTLSRIPDPALQDAWHDEILRRVRA